MGWFRNWSWLRRSQRRPDRKPIQARRHRLHFEILEDRCLMTTVTTLMDSAVAGSGSLRDAIASTPAGGVVDFQPGLSGTITLTQGQLLINKNLTINGPSANFMTVNGNLASRIFDLASPATTVSISGLTITGGSPAAASGGGIRVGPNVLLNITNCLIKGNIAGTGGFGGGLQVNGSINMLNCTVVSNAAAAGGGINITAGPNTFVNCTITGNSTSGSGSSSTGGGLMNGGAASTLITNCTIANNTSVGAGGGIFVTNGSVSLLNTIVAQNTGPGAPDVSSIVIERFSLIGNTIGTSFGGGSGSNQNGQPVSLGALQNNGGTLPTLALLGTSSTNFAIDTGTPTGAPITDERGFSRPVNGPVDLGAFQIQPTPIIAVGGSNGVQGQLSALSATTLANIVIQFGAYGLFAGDIRVATGDVNGDGVLDVITGPGPGGGPLVKIFDGKLLALGVTGDAALLRSFNAINPSFRGGIFVSTGDVNGDGFADVVVGFDGASAGPLVTAFNGKAITQGVDPSTATLASFNAFDPKFPGGAHVAVGDFNNDGKADIVVTPGLQGGPLVKIYSGALLLQNNNSPNDAAVLMAFNAFPPAGFKVGLFVAMGDVDGDGFRDIIVGPGNGGGSLVTVFSGRFLQVEFATNQLNPSSPPALLASFNAFLDFPNYQGGARVAAVDADGDGFADILTGPGLGGGPLVRIYNGKLVVATNNLNNAALFSGNNAFQPPVGFLNGIYVGTTAN